MSNSSDEGMKVYSPDIKPYSFEGRSGVFGTLLSIIVAPIRITTRVMHISFILPANMQEDYAKALYFLAVAMSVLGVVDLVFYKRWPLLISQIPVVYYATRLRGQAQRSTAIAKSKREVEIDTDVVGDLCNTIYDDLEKIFKE